MTFSRAHSTGAVCQPSRFSIITGLFPIRKAIGTRSSIENRLIEADRPTLPNFLRQQGYRTAIVGKWHLDYMLPTKNKAPARANNIDPSQLLPLGAEDYGFDYGFWLIKGHGSAFIGAAAIGSPVRRLCRGGARPVFQHLVARRQTHGYRHDALDRQAAPAHEPGAN